MTNKIVIVGGVAGGASAAARLRRLDEEAKIIVLEKGEYISFANCGLPYYIGGVIEERDRLLVQTPRAMEDRFNIVVRIRNEVVKIDRDGKEVRVKDLERGEVYSESYDYLILSPGAEPIKPPLEGLEGPDVFTIRNIPDTDEIAEFIKEEEPEKAVVVGGGFIGMEMAENLYHRGIEVTIVELLDQVMNQFDREMAAFIHNKLRSRGLKLHLDDGITRIDRSGDRPKVVLQSGKTVTTDMVVLAIGVKPRTELAVEAGLEIGETGAIKVNDRLQTSDEFIYAIGDAVEVRDYVIDKPVNVPLAGPANKQGRIAADNINGREERYRGTQGTSIAKIFDLTVASTGKNERSLREENKEYLVSYTSSGNHAGYYPGARPMTIKIIFTPDEGQLLGAQIVGHEGVDKRIDVLAAALRQGMSVFDLQELELAYAPPYGSAKDPVNMAGYAAGNIVRDLVEAAYIDDIEKLREDAILLDVREEVETQLGTIPGAVNIPLNDLRERLDELDKGSPVLVYCAVGLRGYIAARILMQNGFERVKNLSGGYKLYSAVIDDRQEIIEKPEREELTSISNPEEGKALGDKLTGEEEGKRVQIDACGLQCPGPIMQVYRQIQEIETGDIIEVAATDPGFGRDIKSWCNNTGNELIELNDEEEIIRAVIKKGGTQDSDTRSKKPSKKAKTMVVFSGELDKAIASFIIANGAASMGNEVTLFFTFWGLNILRKEQNVAANKGFMEKMFGWMMPRGSKKLPLSKMNMLGMGPRMIRKVMTDKGVDSLEKLITQARDNGVKLVACQMTMDMLGIKKEELIEGVEVGGVASFLAASDEANMSMFI